MMSLPEQWKYLNKLAEQMRCSGSHEECQKLLQCSATIKDFWIDANREMMDSLSAGDFTIDRKEVTISDYKKFIDKKPEVFPCQIRR